jgi:DNA repair exonuclease SbcCD ATPase subunit
LAKLVLKNVGPFEKKLVELKEKSLNVIGMPNASGKSTILKAIALALSYPFTSQLVKEVASRMGLWAEEPPQPMLRLGSDVGCIELEVGSLRSVCEIRSEDVFRREGSGDERVLFACLASMESELMRGLTEGESDLSKIVSVLSLVDYYKVARLATEEILNEVRTAQDRARETLETKLRLSAEKENLEQELKRIAGELKELETRREKLLQSHDPQLLGRYSHLRKEIEDLNREIEKKRSELEKAYESSGTRELEKLETRRKELENKLEKLHEEKRTLPFSGDEKEIKKRIHEIEVEVADLDREYSSWNVKRKLLEAAIETIKEGVGRCPVCGSSSVDPAYVREQHQDLVNKLQELERKIRKLQNEKETLVKALSRLNKLKKTEESIKSELNLALSQIAEVEKRFERHRGLMRELGKELKEIETRRALKLQELEVLETQVKSVSDELSKASRELEMLRRRQGALEERLKAINMQLAFLEHVEVLGVSLPVERAVELCPHILEALKKLLDHLSWKIEKQRAEFAERFNKTISRLLKDLGFGLEARVDPHTLELTVRRDGKTQRLASLSLSERSALALVAQIALKEAFMPEAPLFLVDEVTLSFDKTRAERILSYFLEMAKKGTMVVLTKVQDIEEVKTIEV